MWTRMNGPDPQADTLPDKWRALELDRPEPVQFCFQFAGRLITDTMRLNTLRWSSHTASRVKIWRTPTAQLVDGDGDSI